MAGLILSITAVVWLLYIIIKNRRKPLRPFGAMLPQDRMLLLQFVIFYRELGDTNKAVFEKRMADFLSTTKITGVNTTVERLDELLIAASAIIPVFGYENWQYINLKEILLYPGSFDSWFNQEGEDRTRAGLVGDGPYQDVMILSKPDLRAGYFYAESRSNTGIHEFAHLIDKTDGAVDGMPESLLPEEFVEEWRNLVIQNIQLIHQQQSDIDAYGATNRAEFFAVISEYFFKQPDQLQHNHPELYKMLTRIYRYRLEE